MTADDATIKALADGIAKGAGPLYRFSDMARSAIATLEELGWGKKPTVTEALRLLDQDKNWDLQRLVDAGFLVEDPEPEWEPTEEAFDALFRMWKGGAGTIIDYIPAVLKHLHDKPHLIGMGEDE